MAAVTASTISVTAKGSRAAVGPVPRAAQLGISARLGASASISSLPLSLSAPGFRKPLSRATHRLRPGAASAATYWVLDPVGDGDNSHLDAEVTKPGPIRLEGEAHVVGRVIDTSDIVIPVPTVSGSHARIELKGDTLVVTDLNSTNGTFLNDQRLRPGSPTVVENGSVVTFGDEHLCMFKVNQVIEAVDV